MVARQIVVASAITWAVVGVITGLFALNGTSMRELRRICFFVAAVYLLAATVGLASNRPARRPTTQLDRSIRQIHVEMEYRNLFVA